MSKTELNFLETVRKNVYHHPDTDMSISADFTVRTSVSSRELADYHANRRSSIKVDDKTAMAMILREKLMKVDIVQAAVDNEKVKYWGLMLKVLEAATLPDMYKLWNDLRKEYEEYKK